MVRVVGTISDGDRPIIRDVPITMQETRWPEGGTSWLGDFDLPPSMVPPSPLRFYRFETADGRSGQIVVRSVDSESRSLQDQTISGRADRGGADECDGARDARHRIHASRFRPARTAVSNDLANILKGLIEFVV